MRRFYVRLTRCLDADPDADPEEEDEEQEEGMATALADLAEFLVEEGLVLVVETARQLRT